MHMSATANGRLPVGISYNGNMEASEAASVLGCSYSTILNLIRSKKLKGQKKVDRWLIDSDDVYRAKNTGLVKPRKSRVKKEGAGATSPAPTPQLQTVKVQFEVDKAKFDFIRMAFADKEKSVQQFITEQLDALAKKVQERLADLQI